MWPIVKHSWGIRLELLGRLGQYKRFESYTADNCGKESSYASIPAQSPLSDYQHKGRFIDLGYIWTVFQPRVLQRRMKQNDNHE
jgi:hypothetical protein